MAVEERVHVPIEPLCFGPNAVQIPGSEIQRRDEWAVAESRMLQHIQLKMTEAWLV